jgi:hypothetical protein
VKGAPVRSRARLLVVVAVLALVVAVVAVVVLVTRDTGPERPAVSTTRAPSAQAEAPTVTLDNGRASIRVYVDTVERQGDLRVVFYEVENTGRRPVDTTQLRAAVDDDQGRRFVQQPATARDTRGVLQPGEAGVITARFALPAGAEPAVLYVAEAGGGQPVPVAIP